MADHDSSENETIDPVATTAWPAPDSALLGRHDVELSEQSFEQFCDKNWATLQRALSLALNNHELGRDAAAEGLTRAWERWKHVSTMTNPSGWVYRVGLNWGRSRLRRRRREVTSAVLPELGTEDVITEPSVAAALAALSDDHRAIVVAKFYLDWSEADIASAFDIKTGTVKSRLHRAIAALEAHLRSTS